MISKHGFTLTEILVVLAIIGTVVFVANGFITADTREHERLLVAADQQRTVALATELLREQIAPAGSGVGRAGPHIMFGCKDRQLELYVHYLDTTVEKNELRHWYFTVVNNRDGARLTRATYNPATMTNDARQPLVPGVNDVRLVQIQSADGSVLAGANITPGMEVRTRAIIMRVHTDVGLSAYSEISLPLVPTVAFLPTWGGACAG